MQEFLWDKTKFAHVKQACPDKSEPSNDQVEGRHTSCQFIVVSFAGSRFVDLLDEIHVIEQ